MSNKNINNTIDNLSQKLKYYKVSFIILSIVILALLLVLIFQFQNTKNNSLFGKFSLLDPSRQFLSPDSYLINIEELRNYLHGLEDKYPDSISIYYEQINSGGNISINKELKLFPASLSKLVQAILITKKVEEGLLSWDEKLETKPEDISSESGELYKSIGNQSLTVEELLKELLVNSDNTAQNIFRRSLSIDDYVNFQYVTGLQDLYHENGFISAKEYTRLLRVLYTSSYLEPENSEKILEHMSNASFKDYLSQGIPSNIKFAHKYGENTQYSIFADSGIVYIPGRPYMLTVMIKGKDSSLETRAWAVSLMKEISEKAFAVSNKK